MAHPLDAVRVAAAIVIVLGILLVLGPGVSVLGLVATEAQDMATGVIRSPLLARISRIRVGPYQVGAQLEQIGSQIVSFIGASALGLIGTATRAGIQLTIAFFGLYYLLVSPRVDLARGPAVHPLLRRERGDSAEAVRGRDGLHPGRHRRDGRSAGSRRGPGVLGGGPRPTRCSGAW